MNNHYMNAAKETLSVMGKYMSSELSENVTAQFSAKMAIGHYKQSMLAAFDLSDKAKKMGFKPLKIKEA